jgi:hypothetical protein
MRKILIVSLSQVSKDPRILRQIQALKTSYEIHVAGYGMPVTGVDAYYELLEIAKSRSRFRRKFTKARFLFFRQFKKFYFFDSRTKFMEGVAFKKGAFDLVLANDFDSLPLIKYRIDPEAKVFLDAHEYYFDEINTPLRSQLFRPYRRWVAKSNTSQLVGMSTVSTGIVHKYKEEFNNLQVSLIRNTPMKSGLAYQKHSSEEINILHHGAAVEGRGISQLIDLVAFLNENFILNLMLVETDSGFLSEIKRKAKPLGERIRFLSPVPTLNIVKEISRFDIGIHLIPPLSVNNEFSLPNKFFEFIQANLAIVIGPTTEMAQIVEAHSLGIVSPSFNISEVASEINKLDRTQIEEFRQNSRKAAEIFCWEEESRVLVSQVSSLIEANNPT